MVEQADGKAEARIMKAVEKVGEKVDKLASTTGEFQIATAVSIAKIQQLEATCPINEIEVRLRAVEHKADQAKSEIKRTSVLISSIIGGIWAAILAFFGWHDKMGG